MEERGVHLDHTTVYRWVQRYTPQIEKRLRWAWRRSGWRGCWHVDETYIKVRGRWVYLYRAVDEQGHTIDFYLSQTRNSKAAKRFLGKALQGFKEEEKSFLIHSDKAPTHGTAIAALKREGKFPDRIAYRQIKYRNNIIEADHCKLKRRIKPTPGFKSMKAAYATIRGFEVMYALHKGQAKLWMLSTGV
jgi:transposase-like protein